VEALLRHLSQGIHLGGSLALDPNRLSWARQ
jgi:hypothetical protein